MFIKLVLHKEHCLDSIIRLKHIFKIQTLDLLRVTVNQLIMKVSRMINNEKHYCHSTIPAHPKALRFLKGQKTAEAAA